MKNLYRFSILLFLLLSTNIGTKAGSPKYYLEPPTNLQCQAMACALYLTWEKPHDYLGFTPAGLVGYSIYCSGVLIYYIPNPDTLSYWDNMVLAGSYTDSITARYDLTSYGFPGMYSESTATSCTGAWDCSALLPFNDPWDLGSFGYQVWNFTPSQGNWSMNVSSGNPLPAASFRGTPALTNYNTTLYSSCLLTYLWTCAHIYLEFDTKCVMVNATSQEKLVSEIYLDRIWYPKDSVANSASTGWIHHKIDISEAANRTIRIGFRVKGINSADLSEWDLDNINVHAECNKPPDFNLSRNGNIVHLNWGVPCIGKKQQSEWVDSMMLAGYDVYRTNSGGIPPFVKINQSIVGPNEYYDTIPLEDGSYCYYVSADYWDSMYQYPGFYLCSSSSDTICIQYTSGIDEQNSQGIIVFPNPVSDILNIQSDQAFTGIEVLNFLGEKVYSATNLASKNYNIFMKGYPSGIYMVKISSGDKIVVRKVVKP